MPADMNTLQIESIITRLKNSDEKNKRLSRIMIFIFSLLTPLYVIMFLRTGSDSNFHLAGAFYVIAFGLFAIYFVYFYKIYNRVNYADPVITVLKGAVKRLRLWNPALILPLISLVLVDAATVLLTRPHLPGSWSTLKAGFVIEAFFISLLLISATIGYLIWKRDQYPILKAAREALQELENL